MKKYLIGALALACSASFAHQRHQELQRFHAGVVAPHFSIGIVFGPQPRPLYVPPPPAIYQPQPGIVYPPYATIYSPPIVRVVPSVRFEPAYCRYPEFRWNEECL